MKDLCSDVLIGHDILNRHSSVEIGFDGNRPPLTICSLAVAQVPPVSLFSNLNPDCRPFVTKSRRQIVEDNIFMALEVQKLLQEGVIEPSSLAVLNHKILEANSQVQNVKLGGHQTCRSINRLWHELCDMLRRLVGTTAPGHHDCSIQEWKKLVIMALYRSPLTVTLWPSSFLKKYGPMIPPAHKAHQTVSFSGCNGVSTYTCGLASLQMRQYGRSSPGSYIERDPLLSDLSRVYTYSYLAAEPTQGYLKRPIEPKPPKSPQFHRPPDGNDRRRTWCKSPSHKAGMQALVESIQSTTPRPRSPHMNNEEPIEYSHYPGGQPPPPNEMPRIERDDFPAPPFPFTDPERRRRWSGSSKEMDPEEDIEPSKTIEDVDPQLKKEEEELSKIATGIGKVFLKTVKDREKLKAWKRSNLDPRNASRTASASKEPLGRLRYDNPVNASPSRDSDHPRPWEEEDFDRKSSFRSSTGRLVGTMPNYNGIFCGHCSLVVKLEISFELPRRIRMKHIFGDGCKDDQLSYEYDLRKTMFSAIDRITAEIRERFQQLQNLAQKYAFLKPKVILSMDELYLGQAPQDINKEEF
ncbi:actin-binding LIM protein 1 [Trichonephila clavipes]|nr:actin-binding LIM protein 1 [Trichonephila clavipes]